MPPIRKRGSSEIRSTVLADPRRPYELVRFRKCPGEISTVEPLPTLQPPPPFPIPGAAEILHVPNSVRSGQDERQGRQECRITRMRSYWVSSRVSPNSSPYHRPVIS